MNNYTMKLRTVPMLEGRFIYGDLNQVEVSVDVLKSDEGVLQIQGYRNGEFVFALSLPKVSMCVSLPLRLELETSP